MPQSETANWLEKKENIFEFDLEVLFKRYSETGAKTLGIMTFSIMTLSIKSFYVTLCIRDCQHK